MFLLRKFNEEPIGPVKKHTLAYLKALVFENDMHILTLEDFLEILKKYKMGSQLELKEGGYERLILEEIQKANIDYEASTGPIVCYEFFCAHDSSNGKTFSKNGHSLISLS